MPRLVAIALLLLGGCRPGEGERCFCEGECRDGFVCAAEGAVLGSGQCVGSVSDDLESGTCIEATNLEEEHETDLPKPQFDLGTGWLTDPAVTTLPGTDGPMTSSSTESTTMEMSSSDSGTASTGVTTTDTDTDTDTATASTASDSTGSSGPATAGTAG